MPAAASLVPINATVVTATSGNVANASAVATIPAVSGRLNSLLGFDVTGSGATAGLPVAVTITGLLGGTLTYTVSAVAGVLVGNDPLIVQFPMALPASAINTAIVVTCAALGAGNTRSCVNAYGFVE